MFSAIRQMMGGNDQADAKGVMQSLDKILKVGLIASSLSANVSAEPLTQLFDVRKTNTSTKSPSLDCKVADLFSNLPDTCRFKLQAVANPPSKSRITMKYATTALVAGYIVRVVKDRHACASCQEVIMMPASNLPCAQLIKGQDRGGVLYVPQLSTYTAADGCPRIC